ncbi:hydroxyacylglutathione hydrolase [Limnofasciculus baicalensis]|uniref:Hydroxyacylglutathione hydrolase n=1 Tax=Limnofasciculus baicalensis BBK-W-15 TaxID=2699891 RepID=A0AAE3GTN6_9CYAN|nr:hydroxyacylglutathione hydrolase [Limnofasciculus baicalensis]MCP2730309.1 hydroxyacylglutathione hydrolase [Limnofasciculus baicalensis BBK-W-15]
MEVYLLPALSDNYFFLLHDSKDNIAAVVDPAEAEPLLRRLAELGAELVAIFNTHHHSDHIGGNRELIQRFPNVRVYGGAEDRGRIPGQQVFLQEGDKVTFSNRTGEVFFVPGHTRAHIAYYFPPKGDRKTGGDTYETITGGDTCSTGELFCGDTLFAGGCGRLFEGTPTQMVNSLSKLRALPDNTRVWCAHEYTLKNLQFALTVDSSNPDLQARYREIETARRRGEATVPSWLGVEKHTNPFLRWDQPSLQAAVKANDPIQTFARLRGMKDQF